MPIVIFILKRRFLAKTQADLNDAWKPPSPSYLDLVPNDLLAAVLAICYAVIAPLILPFAAVNFFLSYLIYKNQVQRVASISAYNLQAPHRSPLHFMPSPRGSRLDLLAVVLSACYTAVATCIPALWCHQLLP